MIINSRGGRIYEVGDVVMLATRRPEGWSSDGNMDMYLGNIVTLTSVVYRDRDSDTPFGQISFSGSASWTFKTTEIECIATPEAIEQYKQRREREFAEFTEKFKTFVTNSDQIFAIAKDIYGEDRVDIVKITESEFQIIVLFPEIRINNSRRNTHIIKDLYVKIDINMVLGARVGDRVSNISLYGRRGMLSDEEYRSNYGHSHFSGNGIERWSDFCLGSSDFSMIVHTMKFSLTEEDWMLLFLSLENYVSWESLEGGPYRKIAEISLRQQTLNPSGFNEHALELIKYLPSSCLTFNSKEIELNTDHPELLQYYIDHSRIKSFRASGSPGSAFNSLRVNFDDHVRRNFTPFNFKGVSISPKIYPKNGNLAQVVEENLDQEVITFYNNRISRELKKYNNHYEYNKLRKNSSSTIFREAFTFQ